MRSDYQSLEVHARIAYVESNEVRLHLACNSTTTDSRLRRCYFLDRYELLNNTRMKVLGVQINIKMNRSRERSTVINEILLLS